MKLILSSCDFRNDNARKTIINNLNKPIDQCKLLYIPNEKATFETSLTLDDMEDMITMSMRTEGDTEKFEVEIRKISDQLCAMRSQLEVARSQTQASEKVNQEIDSIKAFLADTEINFLEYNEIVVRKLIECIRVMPDRKLVIVLKGGITIEEQIAE